MSEKIRNLSRERGAVAGNTLLILALGGALLSGCANHNSTQSVATHPATPRYLVNTGGNPNHSVSEQAVLDKQHELNQQLASGDTENVLEGATVCEYGKGSTIIIVNGIETDVDGEKAIAYLTKDGPQGTPQAHLLVYNNPGSPTSELPACQTFTWGQEPDSPGTVRSVIVSNQDLATNGNYIALDPTTHLPLQTRYGDEMPVGMVSSNTSSTR